MRRILALTVLLLAALPLAAHKTVDQAKQAVDRAAAAAQDLARDAQAVAGAAQGAVQGAAQQARRTAEQAPLDLLRHSLGQHWHNKLVHFPVALGLFGCLFFLAAWRWPAYLWPSRVLLGGALAFGVFAMRTGEAAAEGFSGQGLDAALLWHQRSAQAMMALLAATLLLSFFPSAKRWSWAVAVAAGAAVLFAGALGGALMGA